MSTIQSVQSFLAKILNLKSIANTQEGRDKDEWLAFAKSLSGQAQWNSANVDKLNALKAKDDTASVLTSHISAYYSLVFTWALNDDARAGVGLPRFPIPTPTSDITAFAAANNVDLTYVPVAPPQPVIHAQWVFMVPGGFLAVISPTTGKDSRTGKAVYDALRGDTVPDNTAVTTPDGVALVRHFVQLPFGPEDWYTAV